MDGAGVVVQLVWELCSLPFSPDQWDISVILQRRASGNGQTGQHAASVLWEPGVWDQLSHSLNH